MPVLRLPIVDPDLTSALLQLVRDLADQLRPGSDFAQNLGIDHSLERDYGLDILSRAELLTRIESDLGVSLEAAAFSQAETPRDLLRVIRSTAPASAASASRPVEPEPAIEDHLQRSAAILRAHGVSVAGT